MPRENNLGEPATGRGKREEASPERVDAGDQERQWQIVLRTLLTTLPALTKQLRKVACEGETMATQVSAQFLHIAEKIGASCDPRERNRTALPSAAEPPTSSSETVVQEISRIVVALQFQDAASQRLENLAKLVDEIESVLSRWGAASPEHRQDASDLVSLAWAERICSIRPNVTYTVREPLAGYPVSSDAANGRESHGEIELFSK